MGYDTRYSLKVVHPDKPTEELPLMFGELIIAILRKRSDDAKYFLDTRGASKEDGKWYEHEAELRELSKENPHFLFILKGEGHENGDLWTKYFLNGKVQVAKAVFQIAPFDRSKLK